jgi:hypothetical protein
VLSFHDRTPSALTVGPSSSSSSLFSSITLICLHERLNKIKLQNTALNATNK